MIDREIKFRAWDKQRMIYFSDFSIGLKKEKKVTPYVYFTNDTFNGEVKMGSHQIMQWINQKDKNGKDIYEGDILRYKDDSGTLQIGEVEFSEYKYIAKAKGGDDEGNDDIELHPDYKVEIIGNIYENPELLK